MELPGDGPSGHQFSAETFKTLYLNGGGVFSPTIVEGRKVRTYI